MDINYCSLVRKVQTNHPPSEERLLKHGRKNVRELFFTGQESSDDRGPPLARLTFYLVWEK